jgi:hypothetical protein
VEQNLFRPAGGSDCRHEFFTFYANSWLRSIGDPRIAYENFVFWQELSQTFLYTSSAILLVMAVLAHLKTDRSLTL